MMVKISAAIHAGKFSQADLDGWVRNPSPDGWGLTSITQLSADPVKTQQFYDWMRSAGLID
jgi:hypothetical protein